MAVNWIAELNQLGDVARRMALSVPAALDDPDITLKKAIHICKAVEAHARDFGRFVNALDDDGDASESLLESAKALQLVWDRLSIACADKVRTMKGLDANEFDDD